MSITFSGFEESKKGFTGIPDQFFSEILPAIRDLSELKIILYILWSTYTHGDFGMSFSAEDILRDKKFIDGLEEENQSVEKLVNKSLENAAVDNVLIFLDLKDEKKKVYFINSPRGRAALELIKNGNLPNDLSHPKATLDVIKPNLFQLYQENIGPLTPLIADALRDAQDTYPEDWIDEAIQIAVKNNVRRWKYIETILTRWQEEGRNGTDRRNAQEDYRRYLKGEYGDFGKHW